MSVTGCLPLGYYEQQLYQQTRLYSDTYSDAFIDTKIREYSEKEPVSIELRDGRICIVALNEGGYNSTAVDLGDILDWVDKNMPDFFGDPEKNVIKVAISEKRNELNQLYDRIKSFSEYPAPIHHGNTSEVLKWLEGNKPKVERYQQEAERVKTEISELEIKLAEAQSVISGPVVSNS